eukprot:8069198-Heterocapsa_arctica.AAC.1
MLQLQMRAQLVRDPVLCHAQRLSDHSPVAFRFARRARLTADQLQPGSHGTLDNMGPSEFFKEKTKPCLRMTSLFA